MTKMIIPVRARVTLTPSAVICGKTGKRYPVWQWRLLKKYEEFKSWLTSL